MAVLGAAAGGGGGGQLPTISFMTSQAWTPAYDLTAYVYVIGGGGAGGSTNNSAGGACGGGAGGCSVSKLDLASGTTYTITIGAGGAAQTATSANTNGNAGGATSFLSFLFITSLNFLRFHFFSPRYFKHPTIDLT